MVMSSNSPISDIAEGATKGFLEWSAGKISSLVQKLKERELAFIQERKTIDIVREQYNSGEANFYRIYVKDKELLLLIRMGLTLRRLEEDQERLQNLRDKIFRRYKVNGLHIAEFVQNGILNKYVGILIEELTAVEELEKNIENVLKNIEKHTLFIKVGNSPQEIVKKATILVHTHVPHIFIISGLKDAADVIRKCIEKLQTVLNEYKYERFSSNDKETLFFKRKL